MAHWSFSLVSLLIIITFSKSNNIDRKNRFAVKVNTSYKEKIKQVLDEYKFSWLYEITPETSIIDYYENGEGFKILSMLAELYPDEIVSWETVRVYVNELKPAQKSSLIQTSFANKRNTVKHVEDVYGYTGKGITIAVSDVGVNTDLLELEKTINNSLSYNFVQQTTISSPKTSDKENSNNEDSIIASGKRSTVCSIGIASNATIAALKMYEVTIKRDQSELQQSYWTASDIMSRAMVHMLDEIDIFVNAWSPAPTFEPLDLPMHEAIEYGTKEGRRGLGTIYLVPAGSAGNGLSNNIHTITIGSIGRFGRLPYNAYIAIDASVITSGIVDGSILKSSTVVAAAYKNKCISRFKGLSAATAQVAGIIALGLEANPNLSIRDVRHLLVQASDPRGLLQTSAFKPNAAGKMFHSVFGFGWLNASKFVNHAKQTTFLPTLLSSWPVFVNTSEISTQSLDVEFLHRCAQNTKDGCVTVIEQVHVSLYLKTNTTTLEIVIISPSGTESVLMIEKQPPGVINGQFVTSHFWDELSEGVWTIRINKANETFIQTRNASIIIYGTYRPVETSVLADEDTITSIVKVVEMESDNVKILTYISVIAVIVFIIVTITIISLKCKMKYSKTLRNYIDQKFCSREMENDCKLNKEQNNTTQFNNKFKRYNKNHDHNLNDDSVHANEVTLLPFNSVKVPEEELVSMLPKTQSKQYAETDDAERKEVECSF